MKKIVIVDCIAESVLIFALNEEKTSPEAFLEHLIDIEVISGMNNIHWQVMSNLKIKNYTK